MPRKKPFSSKQKKLQLQEKRRRKKREDDSSDDSEKDHSASKDTSRLEVNKQPVNIGTEKYDPNRYRLHFFKESRDEINARKLRAKKEPIKPKKEADLEVDFESVYRPGSVLDIPKRPPWDYSMSKAQLEAREEKYFQKYIHGIMEEHSPKELSYFEMNLETWRQLWRVLEISDVLLLIVDVRTPVLHFSPALYSHVTQTLRKSMILVINKIDLAPRALTVAWKHYLKTKFPELKIVLFSSNPSEAAFAKGGELQQQRRVFKRGRINRYTDSVGPLQLLRVCQEIVGNKVDLSSWEEKIHAYADQEEDVVDESPPSEEKEGHEMFKGGVLTIGCVGYPNVGKSSLLNGLVGRKVVSVSKTPGHTKHFQTILLTPTVKLCDCPGLVFPSLVDKSLQIIAGIFPIAQVREPYSVIGFLGERINLPKLLNLKHPDIEDGDEWTAFDVCEAWALKKGFLTAKAARPDAYRAVSFQRMALVYTCLCLRPPGYTADQELWIHHQETKQLSEELSKFEVRDEEESEGESTDEEIQQAEVFEKGDNSSESEEESEEGGLMSGTNPFAALAGDN
ncbi:guanine nucleotide-binding protein-like 1 [Saccostrea cucullata]|uniref:guanine nucleotide-binding protein-like 1 n=1 Tax=Saccostrea cuccullata TaxID=36930 RepID=UPI002ED2DDE1